MHITVLVAALFLSTAASSLIHIGPMHRGVYGRKAGSVPDFPIRWHSHPRQLYGRTPPSIAGSQTLRRLSLASG